MMFNDYKMTGSVRQQMLTKKFKVLQRRILKNLGKGIFFLLRKSKQLSTELKLTLIVVLLSVGLLISTQSVAQTFTEQIGASNPFDGEDIGDHSIAAFVDIDNDGDFDAFIGEDLGTIFYYENTGTNSAPVFTARIGAQNPFDGEDVGTRSAPTFVDIDNDGDFDAFIGERDGYINYYENTGTNSVPTFIAQTGVSNPFNGVDAGFFSVPTFVDINNDGDFDIFIGESMGAILYYENTGTNSAPTFTQQTGGSNPFDGVDVGANSSPTFVDINNDGDFDAFIGETHGYINYYENTGTNIAPTFTEQTGGSNPFDGVDVGRNAKPTLVDINNDGDFDAFIGEEDGIIFYYENAPLLPVELTFFKGITISKGHLLTWQTASEENNRGFEVERGQVKGVVPIGIGSQIEWEMLGFVEGNGTTQEVQDYSFTDYSPLNGDNYYRIKQIDFDGHYEYSDIINITPDSYRDEPSNNSTIQLFPNPVSNQLTIEGEAGSLSIYNLLGQPIYTTTLNENNTQIPMASFPSGQYLVEVVSNDGQKTTKRIIKQ